MLPQCIVSSLWTIVADILVHIYYYCCVCSIDENVFVLEYNGTTSAAAPSIAQTLTIPDPLSLTDIYIR